MAIPESNNGIDMRTMGTAIEIGLSSVSQLLIARTPRISPTNILPASPKKTFAGGKLNTKNPRSEPAIEAATIDSM